MSKAIVFFFVLTVGIFQSYGQLSNRYLQGDSVLPVQIPAKKKCSQSHIYRGRTKYDNESFQPLYSQR